MKRKYAIQITDKRGILPDIGLIRWCENEEEARRIAEQVCYNSGIHQTCYALDFSGRIIYKFAVDRDHALQIAEHICINSGAEYVQPEIFRINTVKITVKHIKKE